MNWSAVYPDIVLLTMACVVAMVDLWVTDPRRTTTYWLTLASIAVVGVMHLLAFNGGATVYAAQRMVVADPMGHLLGVFAAVAVIVSLVYARPYAGERDMLKGELFTLSMFSLLGIDVMLSANNFLVVYLGLELMSLSLYALVALRRDHADSTEAAMKYFVLGALASGFLLYGLSMMYGATGSLEISEVFKAIGTGQINKSVLVFGIVFVVAGLGFKLGAVPFHMWLPDVYHGAPTAVTLLIGSAPELATFAFVLRILVVALGGQALLVEWQQMLILLAILSMAVGNITAIAQTNIKRMLAYSTISHMGFMLLGILSGSVNGYGAAMFYIVTYVLTVAGAFAVIMLLSRAGFETDQLDDFKGLNQRNPWYAFIMLLIMFSLAGIPPTVGFYAKLSVFQAVIDRGMLWLAVVAVLFSLIGAFYYLRVVKLMYFDEPQERAALPSTADVRALISANGLAVLVLGLLPGGLMELCQRAIQASL